MPRLHVNSINLQTGFFFQSTTVQQTSSSAPAVTSVSMATTGVMGCLTALTARTREPAVSPEIALSSLDKRPFCIQVFLDQLIFLFKFSPSATRPPGMCHHESEFQCQSDGTCIPSTWECDGHPDCEDSSDEHHACPPRTCPSTFFRCDNGNCVLRSWICDGDNDCRDMSDERDCPTPPFRCPSWQWQCPGHGVCINLTTVCDNTPDCPNGADESPLCSKSHLFSSRSGRNVFL